MAAPALTSSIWPLPWIETGKMVSEEAVPGTFTRIACPAARGWVAQCPGAFEGPYYDKKQ